MVDGENSHRSDEVDPLFNPETIDSSAVYSENEDHPNEYGDTNSEIVNLLNNEGPEYVMEHTIEVVANTKEKLKNQKQVLAHDESETALEDEEEENDEISHTWYKQVQDKFKHKPWYARPTVGAILFIIILRVLCTTLLMTPTVGLLSTKLCDKYAFDKSDVTPLGHAGMIDRKRCDMKAVQKEQSNITSWVTLINSVVGISLSGKYGEFSDRLGRLFVLKLVGFIGMIHTFLMLVAFHPSRPYQKWFALLAMTSDITGGILTLISVGNSYISDIIPPSEGTLAVYISLLMSIVYASLGLGPLISSYLIKIFNGNLIVPYYFTFGVSILYLLVVFIFIKESRHKDAQKYSAKILKKNRLRRSSSISSLKSNQSNASQNGGQIKLSLRDRLYIWLHMTVIEAVEPIGKLWISRTATGSLIPRINTILLIVIDTLFCSSTSGFIPVLLLYCIAVYDWTSVELGYFISIGGIGKSFILLFMPLLVGFLKKRLNYKVIPNGVDNMDKLLLNTSMVFLVASSLVIIIFKKYDKSLYAAAMLQALSAVLSPTIQSCVLKYNSKKIAGQVFAAHTQIRHLTMVFVPIIFLQTYSHTFSNNPMLILSIPSILSILGFILLQFVRLVDDPVLLRRESEVVPINHQSVLEHGISKGDMPNNYGSFESVRKVSTSSGSSNKSINSLPNTFIKDTNNNISNTPKKKTPIASNSYRAKPSLGERRPSILNRSD